MATKNSKLSGFLIKDYTRKVAILQACREADKKANKGSSNQSPSAKTVLAEFEAKQSKEAYEKEQSCPTQYNPN